MKHEPITVLRVFNKREVKKFLTSKNLPLRREMIADRLTGNLYMAEGVELYAFHDPFTGDKIKVDIQMQEFIGSLSLKDQLFHSVFFNEDGDVCIATGTPCTVKTATVASWVPAMMDITFDQ